MALIKSSQKQINLNNAKAKCNTLLLHNADANYATLFAANACDADSAGADRDFAAASAAAAELPTDAIADRALDDVGDPGCGKGTGSHAWAELETGDCPMVSMLSLPEEGHPQTVCE